MQTARATATAIALSTALLLGACSIGTSDPIEVPSSPPVPVGGQPDGQLLEARIATRLDDLIRQGDLPYGIWSRPSFRETSEGDVAGTDMPQGTWLTVGMQLTEPVLDLYPAAADELFLYGPLELYAEAIRPYFEQMAGVVRYVLPWRFFGETSTASWISIDREPMRRYLDGDISVRQLSELVEIQTRGT